MISKHKDKGLKEEDFRNFEKEEKTEFSLEHYCAFETMSKYKHPLNILSSLRGKSTSELWKITYDFSNEEYKGFENVTHRHQFAAYYYLKERGCFTPEVLENMRKLLPQINLKTEMGFAAMNAVLFKLTMGDEHFHQIKCYVRPKTQLFYQPDQVLEAIKELLDDENTAEQCFNYDLIKSKIKEIANFSPEERQRNKIVRETFENSTNNSFLESRRSYRP